jgi:NAD(P)H-nitrite reductase large subunit
VLTALRSYEVKWDSAPDDQIVCYCQNIDKKTIVDAVETGNTTLALIRVATTACSGGNCEELNPSGKCCSGDIYDLISGIPPKQ